MSALRDRDTMPDPLIELALDERDRAWREHLIAGTTFQEARRAAGEQLRYEVRTGRVLYRPHLLLDGLVAAVLIAVGVEGPPRD